MAEIPVSNPKNICHHGIGDDVRWKQPDQVFFKRYRVGFSRGGEGGLNRHHKMISKR